MKASASENDRCAVTFKVRGLKADLSYEGWQKDDWTRPVMSQSA